MRDLSSSLPRVLLAALVLGALPQTGGARNLDCAVRYECSSGSCREVSRHYRTTAGAGSMMVQSQGYTTDLAFLDKTSGGDLIYGGQIGPQLYGVLFLAPTNGAQLMLQGVNGWSESKSEMLICTEATS